MSSKKHRSIYLESTRGSDSRTAKLTDDDVRAMRAVVLPDDVEARKREFEAIAKKYKITVQHCRAIIRRDRWKHLV